MARSRNKKNGTGGGNQGGKNTNTGPCEKGGPGRSLGGGRGGGKNRTK